MDRAEPRSVVLPVLALAAAATAFNLTKAAHMDDGAHLAIAQAILRDPLHPMSALFNWDQVAEPIHFLNQPHLFFYLMAGVMSLTGGSEVALHLLAAIFTTAALFFFFTIARRIAPQRALLATALFALGPAFLPSQNLMVDIPMLALWMGFFLSMAPAGVDRSQSPAWQACCWIAAACLVKYTSLLLLPAFVFLTLRRRAYRDLWALVIPALALAAWSAFNWFDYGGIHLFGRRLGSGASGEGPAVVVGLMAARLPFWLVGLGAVTPFSIVFLPAQWRTRRSVLFACGFAAVAVAVAGLLTPLPGGPGFDGVKPVDALLRGLFFGNGLLLIALAVAALRRQAAGASSPEQIAQLDLLVTWLVVSLAAAVLLAPFPAVRHVLLAIPPLLLLVLGDPVVAPSRKWAARGLALTALLGATVAVADLKRAGVYRSEAKALADAAAGRTVWYVGHWGWDYYAARAGMHQYEPAKSLLNEGDLLVMPDSVHQQALTPDDRCRLTLQRTDSMPADALSRVRTVTRAGGFYYFWAAVPWTFRGGPLEEFRIYSVRSRNTVPGQDCGS